jgi:hypothetical protein
VDRPDQSGHPVQSDSVIEALRTRGEWRGDFYRIDPRDLLPLLYVYGNFVIGYPGFVFRRSAWMRKGGLDERMRICSDYDLLSWLCQDGPGGYLPERLYLRRNHDTNLSHDDLSRSSLSGEFLIHQRFLAHLNLLVTDALAPQVRERAMDQAAALRLVGFFHQEQQLLKTWSRFDPGFEEAFFEHLRRYCWWHCEHGEYRHAMRLLWHAFRFPPKRTTLDSLKATLGHFLLRHSHSKSQRVASLVEKLTLA